MDGRPLATGDGTPSPKSCATASRQTQSRAASRRSDERESFAAPPAKASCVVRAALLLPWSNRTTEPRAHSVDVADGAKAVAPDRWSGPNHWM
jgi:hypothetical protein